MLKNLIIIFLSTIGKTKAFSPVACRSKIPPMQISYLSDGQVNRNTHLFTRNNQYDEIPLHQFEFPVNEGDLNLNVADMFVPSIALASLAFMPLPAEAATGSNQIISAFVAYGHYLSLFGMVGALMFERFTIQPGMSKDDEKSLVLADATYGVSAVALLVSGYYRAVSYGKGWDFYSHEPLFWVKMIFFCILGSASLFPTITSIKRFIISDDAWQPMTVKLSNRMKSVVNAELLMMGSIPLSATLMSRGVGYSESIPYNIIGPVLTAVTALGLGFKYSKEALTWSEDE